MKILILGSSGFIGKSLIKDLPDSIGVSLRSNNWNERFKCADVIINLVGKAHDHKGMATQEDYYYANVALLKNIFEEYIKSKASLFIHISSLAAVEEYESIHPLDENAICYPISLYGISKRVAEEWLLNQALPEGKKLIIVRPPMVHGPGDKGNLGLLYSLISKGIPYPLASFTNSRSFISIGNFNFFIKQIIEKKEMLLSGIYHVADDESISTNDIITVIKTVTEKKVPNVSLPKFLINGLAKMGDFLPIPLNTKRLKKMTSSLLVSNKKIKNALGIQKLPFTAKEGLEITIKSFNQTK
ncbi:NAD-dependent epimerase/dehydratase family protein [Sphingobacterium litopenaei]|uniref:NAD-dependent epimerase/dehydratase family protein n=1 Tax=Sphingobacterium litopenaei TaxID=2763500 RepID=A0ABR7YEM2_9SPHI|nr:NAD-dependent epimerase/dehydratase family protein [Sphingobacterium litopenaei]MBD1429760.1 NAD-dependent epimerase/dehydratase family protein [Sphingobacterium litopenaei]